MRRYRSAKNAVISAVVCFFLMAATILAMPLTLRYRQQSLVYLLGGSFWLFLFLGLVFSFIASGKVKDFLMVQKRGKDWTDWPIGLIGFGKSVPALIFDVLCLLSILGVVIGSFTALKSHYIMYVLIFLAAFSFAMHCLLNGRTLRYLETMKKVRKSSHE
jgi:hypothetical protein